LMHATSVIRSSNESLQTIPSAWRRWLGSGPCAGVSIELPRSRASPTLLYYRGEGSRPQWGQNVSCNQDGLSNCFGRRLRFRLARALDVAYEGTGTFNWSYRRNSSTVIGIQCADVRIAGIDPVHYYLEHGTSEGRNLSPLEAGLIFGSGYRIS
jgi:hypothetical protein